MTPNSPRISLPDLTVTLKDDRKDESGMDQYLTSLHALHGPPGVPSPHAASATSWPISPFVSPQTISFHVSLSVRDLEVLGRGFVPGFPGCPWQDGEVEVEGLWEPEHKWFIFSELEGEKGEEGGRGGGEGVWRVRMYRSWTGVKLVELRIKTGFLRPAREDSPSQDGTLTPGDGTTDGIKTDIGKEKSQEEDPGPRITHITFETHRDYKLKGADATLYKYVAREVCWWVMGVCLGPETLG